MERDLADLHEVEILPFDSVAFFVLNAQIPFLGFCVLMKFDLNALAVFQRVFAENVRTPFVRIGGRNVKGESAKNSRIRLDLDLSLMKVRGR